MTVQHRRVFRVGRSGGSSFLASAEPISGGVDTGTLVPVVDADTRQHGLPIKTTPLHEPLKLTPTGCIIRVQPRLASRLLFFLSIVTFHHHHSLFPVCFGYTTTTTISGIPCHKVPLRQNDPESPFCFAVSSAMDLEDYGQPANFLASQVWPSARVAAIAMEQQLSAKALSSMTVCEFGCGPGLPSLTAAKLGAQNVVATDLDPLALELVQKASEEQGFQHVLQTQRFDLTGDVLDDNKNRLPEADLYLLSDVFESKQVALGAARVTCQILHKSQNARIWVFAQSDRACREDYLEAMRKQHQDKEGSRLEWLPMDQHDIRQQSTSKLLLFDLDETTVAYG